MPAHDAARFSSMMHARLAGASVGDPVAPPLVMASKYVLPGTPGESQQYGRFGNPTWSVLEEALGVLEGGSTTVFSSGMAAISAALFTSLSPGERLLLPSDGYYTTRLLAQTYLAPLGITIESCPTREYASYDLDEFAVVFVESPSNPSLDLCDIALVARRAHAAGALVVADNTTMTALGQRPLDLGADVVVASDTKAVNGHSDVVLGHLTTRSDEVTTRVRDWRKVVGAVPGPFEAWLVYRGLESLEVRLDRMCSSAAVLAERLVEHPSVVSVGYPGLASHPDHRLASRQMELPGFLVSVDLGSAERAERFIDQAALIAATTSFGAVQTTAERRARWGDAVPEGSIRLSVGCEPTDELWRDLQSVLDGLSS